MPLEQAVGLATDSDEDWFQFTATAGQVLSVNVEMALGSTMSRPMVEIVSASQRSMAVADGLGDWLRPPARPATRASSHAIG